MKKLIFSAILLSGAVNAQVSLQNVTNQNLIFDMKQGNTIGDKTFVLPTNTTMQADRKQKSNVNTSTNTTLESGLLIYNATTANGNDKGPYFWYNYNTTLGAWTPFVNSDNRSKLTNLNYLDNVNSSIVKTDNYSQTNNPSTNSWINNIGDDIGDTNKRWQELTEFNTPFTIYNTKNIINLKLAGFAEAFYGSSNAANFSFDVGIFIDNKLAVYSPFAITTNKFRDCTYNTYNLVGLLQNLTVGTHTVRVAVKNRNILASTNTTSPSNGSTATIVTYNARNASCGSSSENGYLPNQAINEGLLNIQIQENPSILNN